MPGLANVAPALVVSIYEHARAGRLVEAKAAQKQLAPLRAAYGLGTFPAVVKVRRPGLPLKPEVRQKLRDILTSVLGEQALASVKM